MIIEINGEQVWPKRNLRGMRWVGVRNENDGSLRYIDTPIKPGEPMNGRPKVWNSTRLKEPDTLHVLLDPNDLEKIAIAFGKRGTSDNPRVRAEVLDALRRLEEKR